MLTSTSKFITLLRKNKIVAPTVRKFDPEQWERDYREYGTEQSAEREVYEAGLWIGAQLKLLWGKIYDMNLAQYKFNSFISSLHVVFFKNYRIVSDQCQLGSLASLEWGNYGLTALGDSLWRTLNFLGSQKSCMFGDKTPEEREVAQLLKIFNEIYGLEYFMGRVIHCGWVLTYDGKNAKFEPGASHDHFLMNEAIALDVRNDELLEFVAVYRKGWENGGFRDQATHHIKLLQRTGYRASFAVVEGPPNDMPFTIPLFAMDIPSWMGSSLEKRAHNFKDLKVIELLSGWLLIGQAFNEIDSFELSDAGRLEYGCGLAEVDLIKLFKSAGYSEKKAETIIGFLSYDWKPHEDLWGSPLVKIGKIFYPFLPALLDSNLTRTIDLWLKKCTYMTSNGKLDEMIGSRGLAFEQHVRDGLKIYMEECSYVDGFVLPVASKIVGGDIDLFWRMDNLVIVADTKFNKFPANPNEIGNYYRELEHGAEQVNSRIEKLKNKRKEVARLLQWKGDPEALEFQALVVCGHPFGAGLSFNDVPCIQYDMLELLFGNQHLPILTRLDGIISRNDIVIPFVKRQGEFIDFFKKYVTSPAPVWFRAPGLTSAEVPGAVLSTEIPMIFKHWAVVISKGEDRRSYCVERSDTWQREFIGAEA